MASFVNTSSTTGFDATTYAHQVASQRASQRSGSQAGYTGIFSGKYSVVGINTKSIPEMRAAIRNYVDRINEHLDGIRVSTQPDVALKGTGMEEAVKDYVGNVVSYCRALCSNLLAFSDKLAKVEEAWKASDTTMASTINNASSDLNSAAGQTYNEQFMS